MIIWIEIAVQYHFFFWGLRRSNIWWITKCEFCSVNECIKPKLHLIKMPFRCISQDTKAQWGTCFRLSHIMHTIYMLKKTSMFRKGTNGTYAWTISAYFLFRSKSSRTYRRLPLELHPKIGRESCSICTCNTFVYFSKTQSRDISI